MGFAEIWMPNRVLKLQILVFLECEYISKLSTVMWTQQDLQPYEKNGPPKIIALSKGECK